MSCRTPCSSPGSGWGACANPRASTAWLDGICRNRCRHHRRDAQAMARRDASAPGARGDSGGAAAPAGAGWPGRGDELADPLGFDPAEDLARQDWEALLDRALGYLSAQARSVVELCYLAEEPRRAAAERLGLSVGALEMRAHRARRQLRAALAGPLRGEAEAAGLLLDPEPAADWRETREWCPLCARRRLRGLFAPQPDGSVRLCLRCPDCSPRYGTDIFRSEAVAQLGTLTSFRPALKRALVAEKGCYRDALLRDGPRCPRCGARARGRLEGPDEFRIRMPNRFWIVLDCAACSASSFSEATLALCWADSAVGPAFQAFVAAHPRRILAPVTPVSCAGQAALRFQIVAALGDARLTILAHAQTLHVLRIAAE